MKGSIRILAVLCSLLFVSLAHAAQSEKPRIRVSADTTSNCSQAGQIDWEIYDPEGTVLSSGNFQIPATTYANCKRYMTQLLRRTLDYYTADNYTLDPDSSLPVAGIPQFAFIELPNDTVTGTTLWQLVKPTTDNPSKVIKTAAGDTNALGVCIGNCGTSGSAMIALIGNAKCDFDGATTANNFVQVSTTVAGKCQDVGVNRPTRGKVVGRVRTTNGAAGTYEVTLFGIGVQGSIQSTASPSGLCAKDDGTFGSCGGGSTPTGTGFRHVTAGVEDAASKLVENADVHASAAIVESKLALNNATHSNANDPVAGEKSALAGTSGTPGSGNKYVTDADARNSNARTPTAHTHALGDLPFGTANQLLGTNAGATAQEHKSLAVGTSGTDFAIAHAANSITLNLPTASASVRGALASADWTTFNNKQAALGFTPEDSANKNAASGYAGLSAGSKIAASQMSAVLASGDLTNSASIVLTGQSNTYSTGTQDFEGAAVTRPFRRLAFASFPGTCTANREFLERSDPAAAGQVLYVCNSAGTGWDLVGDGTGGGSNHNILSATHSDSAAASVARGGGIFGIGATPAWTLVGTTTADRYFKRNSSGDIVESTLAAAGTGSPTVCSDQFVTGFTLVADAAPTSACTTATLASAQFANQGTTTTVLHGNAAGNPSFGAVSLTADVSGILPGANGGTGNGFFAVSGPATSLKTFTFPNASAAVLTDNAVVTVAQGGTGTASTLTGLVRGSASAMTAAELSGAVTTSGSNATTLATKYITFSRDVTIDLPTDADTFKVQLYFGQAVTITRVVCSISTGTNAVINWEERAEATPNSAGTQVLTADLTCNTTNGGITTSFANATIAARVPFALEIVSVSGAPGSLRVHVEGTVD